jgi:hypothetical protein
VARETPALAALIATLLFSIAGSASTSRICASVAAAEEAESFAALARTRVECLILSGVGACFTD